MKKLLYLSALMLSFACQAETVSSPLIEKFYGIWEGSGKQDNNSVWSIKVTLDSTQNRIDYPSLNCGGVLEFIKEIDQSILFKENISYGTDKCINHGTTALTLEKGNKLFYDWFYPDGSAGAEGSLIRTSKIKKSKQ